MIELIPCISCARFDRQSGVPRCDAFPGRIPDEILVGGNDHLAPFPGDHGLQWTPSPSAPAIVQRTRDPFGRQRT